MTRETVTDATRAKAAHWLNRFEAEVKRLGYLWMVPWAVEHIYDDGIDFDWWRESPPHRSLLVTVWGETDEEPTMIDYLREESRDPKGEILEGKCEEIETCRLLWHWLWN